MCYIMIKGLIFQVDKTALNVYVFNDRVLNYRRQKLMELQGEIDESTTIVGDFIASVSEMGRPSRQGNQE